jgi:integrase
LKALEHSPEPVHEATEPAAAITVADVIGRLEADPSLSPARRSAMRSALRTVCRILNADPRSVPAELRNLRRRLEGVAPAATGLSRGRWNNVRSLTLAALRQAGIRAMPGGRHRPLGLAWEPLYARLPDRKLRCGLSRFMRFCTAHQIAPDAVDVAVFERFRDALENDSLVRHAKTVYRTACVLWNKAAETIPGWLERMVPVPNKSRRYTLSWGDLPAAFKSDADAYFERLGNQDPFADDYVPSLRPATIEFRRQQILQLATALVLSGFPAEKVTHLATLSHADNARLALRFFWDRAGGKSTEWLYNQAILLRGIARHWVKPRDAANVEKLETLCKGLAVKKRGMTDKNRERLRQFDDGRNVDGLLDLPARVMRRVGKEDRGGHRDAVPVAFALAIELLLVAPIRIKNLTSLESERHLLRTRIGRDAVVHLVIPGDEMKNGEPYEMALPQESAELVDEYLRTYRSRLTPAPSPWLFPGYGGKRRHPEAFARLISEFVLRETGIRMHVHLFRHLAVKLHLEAHPEDVETARRILGHKSLRTTLRAYADVKNATAFRRYDELIATLRERSRRRVPSAPLRRGAA